MIIALRSFALCFVLFLASSSLQAEDQADYGTPAGRVRVPIGLTTDVIRRRIIQAAEAREWVVTSQNEEQVVIELTHRKWIAKLTVRFTTEEIRFFSTSTKAGKPKVPDEWVENLEEDLAFSLRPPKPRRGT